MDGLVGQAEAFLRIVSEGPLDLIVAAHAKRCVDIAVASVKGVVARAIDSFTLACGLRTVGVRRRKLERSYISWKEILVCLVTVFIGMLKGRSTWIIKGVRGSWEMQDTRSSICPYTKRV